MLYSQLLKSEYFMTAMSKAKVDDIQSPLLEGGDFPSGLPDDLFTDPKKKYLVDSLHQIIDLEILGRCQKAQLDQLLEEHETKIMKPLREKESKIEYLKPVVQKYIGNNLKPEFHHLETGFINLIAKETVEGNEFQVHPEFGFESGHHHIDDSISELQNIIKAASIIRLNDNDSPDEVVLRTIFKNGYSILLKEHSLF